MDCTIGNRFTALRASRRVLRSTKTKLISKLVVLKFSVRLRSHPAPKACLVKDVAAEGAVVNRIGLEKLVVTNQTIHFLFFFTELYFYDWLFSTNQDLFSTVVKLIRFLFTFDFTKDCHFE